MDELLNYRKSKDLFFRTSQHSPLTREQKARFTALSYYDPNPALVFELPIEENALKESIKMQTSTGDTRYYLRWGKIRFTVEGQEAELTLYASPGDEDFFVPFMDATSGSETYGAGRYIEVQRLTENTIHIDFNQAYNPYCAYNPPLSLLVDPENALRWSCPIPPPENRLKVAIRAGEKKPVGDWVESE